APSARPGMTAENAEPFVTRAVVRILVRSVVATLLAAVFACAPAAADDFYAGKQITFIAGSGVGGGYDLLARLAPRHIGRLIPRHPPVLVQKPPAARHLPAAQHIPHTPPRG